MSYVFKDLQDEVLRRATRDQSGTNFRDAAKNLLNASLIRIGNECPWRALRRMNEFDTIGKFTTGTVAVTNGSKAITFTGSNLITAGVVTGRRIELPGSSKTFTLDTITGENTATIDLVFDGVDATGKTFTIFGQDIYNLPIQTGRLAALWHEGFNFPFLMQLITDREFLFTGLEFDSSDTPEVYRMWGEDWVITQPRQPSILSLSSSNASETANVTIFGDVDGFPDFDIITANGTSTVAGVKTFQNVERVVAGAPSLGRITVTANNVEDTVAVIPLGDTTSGIKYKKVQFWPSPDEIIKVTALYYKEPFRMVNDCDVHELGQDFDELIIMMATAKLDGEQSKKSVQTFFSMYKDELLVLRRKNADKLDQLLSRGRPGNNPFESARRFGGVASGPQRWVSFQQVGSRFGPASFF